MLNTVSDMDLRLLRVFIAIVQAGGITPAQWVLNVSQSTLSTQLATLETRLGFRLCERGRGGFRLTEKGERVATMASQLLTNISTFEQQTRNINKQLVGTLNIGLIGHIPIGQSVCISDAIQRFRLRDEAVRFNLSVSRPREMEESLVGGDLQLAVGYFWHRVPTLEYTPLFIERQIAYCGSTHRLASRAGTLTADELMHETWAWRSYPVPGDQTPPGGGQINAVADNMEAMAVLIMSGHLGYLPQHFAAPYIARGLLVALNPDEFRYDATFHVATHRKREQGDITKAFVEDLRHVVLLHKST